MIVIGWLHLLPQLQGAGLALTTLTSLPPWSGDTTWESGRHEVAEGAALVFAAGTPVPTTAGAPTTDEQWLRPMAGDAADKLLEIYSILIAGLLGTMGLPSWCAPTPIRTAGPRDAPRWWCSR